MAGINERELAFALMCKSTDGNILVTFPMALMRTLVKAVWERKVSFSSQFQRTFILAGRAWQQKLGAPDHILLAVGKERAMDGYAQLSLSLSRSLLFIWSRMQASAWDATAHTEGPPHS